MSTTVSPCYSCGPHPGCSEGCKIIEAWKATGKRDKAFVILMEFYAEYQRAKRYPPMNSCHEGYAVILEEYQELGKAIELMWEKIKESKGRMATDEIKDEAIQVGAMALRFLKDLGGDHELP